MSPVLCFIVVLLLAICHSDTVPVACYGKSEYKFCNKTYSFEERINDLISLLTLDEKAVLLTARQSPSNAIDRLGIPEFDWGANCIHSVLSRCGSNCPTLFPEPNGLGSTFNKTLIRNISAAIGLEMRALWAEGVGENKQSNLPHIGLTCWGPTINIGRDPRWGRMYEVISEDPYWNSIYGTMFTLGLQNGSIDSGYYDPNYFQTVATLKHFAAYSLGGYQSFTFDANVSKYMFSDTYFPPFAYTISHANPRGVMCSYNAVNGVPACLDDFLLKQTLREKWKFNGYVTSDTGAIKQAYAGHHYTTNLSQAVVDGLTATCDINSGHGSYYATGSDYGTSSPYTDYVPMLVNNNEIPVNLVDEALFNSFRIRFELGLFDQPVAQQTYFNVPGSVINNEKHKELNLFATHQTMTLLKNENKTLPFDATNRQLIYGIIGVHYNATTDLLIQGGYTGQLCREFGSTQCVPSIINSGIAKYIDSNNILSAQGCDVLCNSTAGFENAIQTANKSDVIVLIMGLNQQIEKEGIDRTNISLPGYQQLLASQICALHKPTVLVLVNGGIVAIDELKEECPAILEVWYPGWRGAEAIADTLFGANNPCGKLPVTMYWSNFTTFTDWHGMDLTAPPFGRTYKYWSGTPPLFAFGHGISYTSFQFKFVNNTSDCNQSNNLFCVEITNVGEREGCETIFVFIVPPGNSTIANIEPAAKMVRRLVEFDKTQLMESESFIFKWTLDKSTDLMLYDVNGEATLFPGQYRIQFSNGVDQNLFVNVDVSNDASISLQQ